MIIENVQREDLNAMEEAQGYHALADEFKRSQEDIAKEVGKSRSHVANMMRLTKLPAEVQAFIANGELSAGHARALIGVPDPLAAAKRIVEEGLNVRQTEALAHEEGVPERKPQKARGGGGGEGQGSRHDRAGKARQRCARPCRDRQPPRSRRQRPDQLPQPRTARRGDATAGEGRLSHTSSPRHCERERSNPYLQQSCEMDCFAALAMTARLLATLAASHSPRSTAACAARSPTPARPACACRARRFRAGR